MTLSSMENVVPQSIPTSEVVCGTNETMSGREVLAGEESDASDSSSVGLISSDTTGVGRDLQQLHVSPVKIG